MANVDALLAMSSRTFAITIPLLPDPVRREVAIAYLLFRIADTFEDATCWPRALRLKALGEFGSLLRSLDMDEARALTASWTAVPPCTHAGYLELLSQTPSVIEELLDVPARQREIIVRHALRTTAGMAEFVDFGDELGRLRLLDEDDLRRYCYTVAGIVGELLTELFLDAAPQLAPVEAVLKANAVAFGEGLQLVNILKDANDDAQDGRVYLPPTLERAQVIALAGAGLLAATNYVLALQAAGAPRGFVSFTALATILAKATLGRIEVRGAGAKLTRHEVMGLTHRLHQDLDLGLPAVSSGPTMSEALIADRAL